MVFTLGRKQIHRAGAGDEQKVGIFNHPFNTVVHGQPRFIKGMGHVMIELFILFFRNVFGLARPDGRGAVERVFFLAAQQNDGNADMVRISCDDVA